MSFNECTNLLNSIFPSNNSDENFYKYVYKKISRNTKNRFVDQSEESVDIILSNHPSIKVLPIFKNIDKNNLSIKNEIQKACNIIENSDFKYVYFVYPKNNNFNKHIQIKIPRLEEACNEYLVKLIPYSLNDILKKRSCNNDNSNILCK